MKKNILKIIAFFVIGMAGGIFADQIFWPYFVERPLFYQYRLDKSPIYITEKREVTVQENTALKDAIEGVKKTVIGVRTKTQTGQYMEGSGLIVTNDGLIVTLATLIPKDSVFSFWVEGEAVPFQILKRDLSQNLALIKIEKTNLSAASFADSGKLKLGERVFLIGVVGSENKELLANEGMVRSFTEDYIQTNIFEGSRLAGSSLFNIKGEVLGLNTIDAAGRVSAIPVSKIKEFIGF